MYRSLRLSIKYTTTSLLVIIMERPSLVFWPHYHNHALPYMEGETGGPQQKWRRGCAL